MRLLERGDVVVGIDNHNAYYDKGLKEARLARHADHQTINTFELTSQIKVKLKKFFSKHKPQRVVHLAAQAGVRYSLENPMAWY